MSSADDKFLKILEKIGEVSEKVGRVETQCDNMREDIKEIKQEDAKQNEQLIEFKGLFAEHIQGVKSNTARLEEEKLARLAKEKETGDRLDALEEGPKMRATIRKKLIYLAGTLAAIMTILKFLDMF